MEASTASTPTKDLSAVYISVKTRGSDEVPRLLLLDHYRTAEELGQALLQHFTEPSQDACVQYPWWPQKWFHFTISSESDFNMLIGTVKQYNRAPEGHLLQFELCSPGMKEVST